MASKRAVRRRSCQRKVRHETHAAAPQALRLLTLSKGFQGHQIIYRCAFCGGYHYGHPPARVLKAWSEGKTWRRA